MSLIAHSPSYFSGWGKIFFEAMEDSFVYVFADDIFADICNPGVAPILNSSTGERYEAYYRIYVIHPIIRVRSESLPTPFTSAPETRYKLGTWSYSRDVDYVVLPDETVRVDHYFYAPQYLVYERQTLDAGLGVLASGSFTLQDWDVGMDEFSGLPSNELIFSHRFDQLSPKGLQRANAISVNLPPGVIADMAMFYEFTSITPFNPQGLPNSLVRF